MADIADVARITREESEFLARRRAGQTDKPIAVPMQETEVVDAEVVPDEDPGLGPSGDGEDLKGRDPAYLADRDSLRRRRRHHARRLGTNGFGSPKVSGTPCAVSGRLRRLMRFVAMKCLLTYRRA